MNLHRTAKTTPRSRRRSISRIEPGWTIQRVASTLGISERTVYKWLSRFGNEGAPGLEGRTSRPRRRPRRISPWLVRRVEQLRRRRLTTWEIAARSGLPASTVSLILRRTGLHRLSRLAPNEPVRRYERQVPGELVHVDIKKPDLRLRKTIRARVSVAVGGQPSHDRPRVSAMRAPSAGSSAAMPKCARTPRSP